MLDVILKAKVALEALRGEQTVPEIAAKHGIHHTLVNEWKRALTEGGRRCLSGGLIDLPNRRRV